ncbi:MAG: hypothetical protein KY437_08795 [Actinobacteria bacterium]|nr:hypothetical protein [Actinomycetota bacterium]
MPWWALGAAGFVLAAVGLEVLGGGWANSPAPGWSSALIPLGWPTPARVVWWLLVAAAAGTFHVGVARSGHGTHPVVGSLTVAMFVAFAVGIAFGAEWAAWH